MIIDCGFSWEDDGEHEHLCVYVDPEHAGEHVCHCGEHHETGHEVE